MRCGAQGGEKSHVKPMTEEHLAILRRHMVEVVDIHFDLAAEEIGKARPAERVREAMLTVPRHLFVPAQFAIACYQDTPLPIGFDKTVSQPFIGALMLDLLDLAPGQSVLEVGTGLGYQAAVMAEMGAEGTVRLTSNWYKGRRRERAWVGTRQPIVDQRQLKRRT